MKDCGFMVKFSGLYFEKYLELKTTSKFEKSTIKLILAPIISERSVSKILMNRAAILQQMNNSTTRIWKID